MAKILIVEDERSVRKALCFELEDEGYEVIQTSNFQDAVSAFDALDYDMVISDIFLDKGDGMQLLEMARRNNKNVPFIAITAYPESDLANQARSILKDRYFEKPFFAPELTAKVQEILHSQNAA